MLVMPRCGKNAYVAYVTSGYVSHLTTAAVLECLLLALASPVVSSVCGTSCQVSYGCKQNFSNAAALLSIPLRQAQSFVQVLQPRKAQLVAVVAMQPCPCLQLCRTWLCCQHAGPVGGSMMLPWTNWGPSHSCSVTASGCGSTTLCAKSRSLLVCSSASPFFRSLLHSVSVLIWSKSSLQGVG
jgi:hypothetical protein